MALCIESKRKAAVFVGVHGVAFSSSSGVRTLPRGLVAWTAQLSVEPSGAREGGSGAMRTPDGFSFSKARKCLTAADRSASGHRAAIMKPNTPAESQPKLTSKRARPSNEGNARRATPRSW
jgi:hypothetical protein